MHFCVCVWVYVFVWHLCVCDWKGGRGGGGVLCVSRSSEAVADTVRPRHRMGPWFLVVGCYLTGERAGVCLTVKTVCRLWGHLTVEVFSCFFVFFSIVSRVKMCLCSARCMSLTLNCTVRLHL